MKDGTQATWTVESMDWKRRNAGITYKVSLTKSGTYHCTCDAFKYGEGQECKHINYVQAHPALLPDQERMTGEQVASLLNDALHGRRDVVIRVKNGTISLSDR